MYRYMLFANEKLTTFITITGYNLPAEVMGQESTEWINHCHPQSAAHARNRLESSMFIYGHPPIGINNAIHKLYTEWSRLIGQKCLLH